MTAQIIPLSNIGAPIQKIGHFFRIGDTGHSQLADLHEQGLFSPKRVVVDASRMQYQKNLIGSLKEKGTRTTLDTKAAELSSANKFAGYAKGAPWAKLCEGKPLDAKHFQKTSSTDLIGQIARYAVQNNFDSVLSPSHFLADRGSEPLFDIDRRTCIFLRQALDHEGGSHIGIDFSLILPHVILNNVSQRGMILNGLKDLPFENLWIRASGFGSDGAPSTIAKYMKATSSLHNLGKPIIGDYLGGLVGLAASSFGTISGFAAGAGERERFDARQWHKPPIPKSDSNSGFGRAKRIAIAGFGRSITLSELELLAKVRGGRKLVSCNNKECCPHGLDDMIKNPRQHEVFQRFNQVEKLEKVPDLKRGEHFLNDNMVKADRLARQIKMLKTSDEKLNKRMADHSIKLEKIRATLEHVYELGDGNTPRAIEVIERSTLPSQSKSDRS